MKDVPYRQLVGSLMYIALATRPDTLYAATKLAQFVSNPGRIHWIQAKKVLRYLYATKEKGLKYGQGINEIEMYSDADWATDIDDRHSHSGMVVFLGGNPITWKSSKQKSISTSTMESEYIALENAVKEAMWMKMLFKEIQSLLNIDVPREPYMIRCDNKSDIDFTPNRVERSKSKHIDIAYHITREKYEEGLIKLKYVPSSDNVADYLLRRYQ
ncbi:secreted RxLR effector protein 161-like [Osmia bicornis bicornis]|uniref:secreted RxLR effector protein 161-like n=1 Tax=Osmia bicornis bicornis TaxID=1437191 RepID=UPI001EAF2CF0|nr:secreted RxLR effector protein 161-like [Osmia bicornis bicornis]